MYNAFNVQIFREKISVIGYISKKYCQIATYLNDYGCSVVGSFPTYNL